MENPKLKFEFDEIYYTQLHNFMKKIKNKKSNICDSESAYHTMRIIEGLESHPK